MKKLLIIPMLFMCSMVIGQSKKIIGKPIKIENLEVAQHDFPESMYLPDAKKIASDIGDGWRVPTIKELKLLYINRYKIGGFNTDKNNDITLYISSTEIYGSGGTYREIKIIDFSDGTIGWDFWCCKGSGQKVRFVKTIKK